VAWFADVEWPSGGSWHSVSLRADGVTFSTPFQLLVGSRAPAEPRLEGVLNWEFTVFWADNLCVAIKSRQGSALVGAPIVNCGG
jgi:hypothetical protein